MPPAPPVTRGAFLHPRRVVAGRPLADEGGGIAIIADNGLTASLTRVGMSNLTALRGAAIYLSDSPSRTMNVSGVRARPHPPRNLAVGLRGGLAPHIACCVVWNIA